LWRSLRKPARPKGTWPPFGLGANHQPVNQIHLNEQSALKKGTLMQLGMIGLGRMGSNMVRRLLKAGHNCVVFDVSPKAVEVGPGESGRRLFAGRPGQETREATGALVDGAGGN